MVEVLPDAVVDTDQMTDLNSRPPLPYDPEASIDKSAQEPIFEGALMMTVGAAALSGACTIRLPNAVALDEQADAGLEQNALNVLFNTVILSRTLRYLAVFVAGDMAAKVTDTVVAFSHAHDESALFPKSSIVLQGQEMAVRPALSVGESNVTKTVCPLSENLAVRGCGAGTGVVVESNLTLTLSLEYSVELNPEKRRATLQSPEVL